MRNTIIIALISLLAAGCSKDKFNSIPGLKFKSVNTRELSKEQSIQFKLSFTDLEGDLQDSIYIEKVAINCSQSNFKQYYTLPPFPRVKNSEGDIIISYTYGTVGPFIPVGSPVCGGNDTCYYRFMIQDEAKQKSDTVESGQIVIIK